MTRRSPVKRGSRSGLSSSAQACSPSTARPPRKGKSRSPAPATLELDTEHILPKAPALHTKLVSLVDHASDVTIDAAATQRIDAANLQLLYAFVRDRSAKGLSTKWHDPARVIESSARRIGLLLDSQSRAA